MSLSNLASTGIKSLDEILQALRKGDNVVWQIENISDYLHFVVPFAQKAINENKRIVYIRFAQHAPIISDYEKIQVYKLDASHGFESFTKQVHEIIADEGMGVYYIFDCLSDLLLDWATDLMIGNFFMVTCPYLFKLDTVAYFAIMRNSHSFKTIARIRETTQLLLDAYNLDGKIYVHPLKVWKRYSPTMFLPHLEENEKFMPVTNSVDAAKLFSLMSDTGVAGVSRNLDYWDRLFYRAEKLLREESSGEEKSRMSERLEKIMLGRESRMMSLIKDNFSLEDLLQIKSRMIGTGFIGGKALGMLLARKILSKEISFEPHDSFYIGSDVFYTYIVENGWWELWLEQKTEEGYFSKAEELQSKMMDGKFPEEIREQFHKIIEYFGQSPIIIRSSSLLEDSFGNAFAGKYESIFCANQGSPEERYSKFEETVKRIFASTMNDDALNYRIQRGLNKLDEQMALLVQRVSGTQYKKYFFPYIAGVGISYNTFVWHKDMDPRSGMLRLVFGMGTRAVNRVEGDYPRIVALDAPMLAPYSGTEKIKKFSQHDVDVIDIDNNDLRTVSLAQLMKDEPNVILDLIGIRDRDAESKLKQIGISDKNWILTFDKLLASGDFISTMSKILKTLEECYQYPVDIEFTANYSNSGKMNINLLQCRPLQTKGTTGQVKIPKKIPGDQIIFKSEGNIMGGSVSQKISRLIFVDPSKYADLIMSEKYDIARIIGKINKKIGAAKELNTLLIGPGRWGTRDPSLGIPVNFAEINNISILVELDDPDGGFTPELSFGSHFFLDLVETNIFYVALFLDNEKVVFNRKWINSLTNNLETIVPESTRYSKIIKVHDFINKEPRLLSDVTSQKVVCIV